MDSRRVEKVDRTPMSEQLETIIVHSAIQQVAHSMQVCAMFSFTLVFRLLINDKHVNAQSSEIPVEVQTGRVLLITFIGPATLFMSYLPWIMQKRFQRQIMDILALGSAFSAGVILGAAFSHIAPDASNAFSEYFALIDQSESKNADYPYSALISIAVFFILLLIDKLIVDPLLHGRHEHLLADVRISEDQSSFQYAELREVRTDQTPHPLPPKSLLAHKEDIHHHAPQSHVALALSHFSDGDAVTDMQLKHLGTAYIFLIALSMHSIFDGLAVGSETDTDGFYGLITAVVIHKLLDGFALGVPIYYAKFSRLQTFLALTFCAAMTPLGIAIGWITTGTINGAGGVLTRAMFLSMSLGSFIYIGLIELLPAALESRNYLVYNLATAIFGWLIMALIAFWV